MEYERRAFVLKCADCGERLFKDEHMDPPLKAAYLMNFSQTAYQCDCGFIGTPIVEEVRSGPDEDTTGFQQEYPSVPFREGEGE